MKQWQPDLLRVSAEELATTIKLLEEIFDLRAEFMAEKGESQNATQLNNDALALCK